MLENTVALLTRTPATLDTLLRGLPEVWTTANEGGDTFSAVDVLRHLIHAEHADWMPRIRTILEFGEARPFEAFDRRGGDAKLSLGQSLDDFARLRARNLVELRKLNLTEADLARRGAHPAFGTVTLSQLLATWAAHDLTHLHQVSRILAHQYRDAVGPWSAYLGVLQCDGHSK